MEELTVKILFKTLTLGFLVTLTVPSLWAQPTVQLRPETVEGFERYVARFERKYDSRSKNKEPAFWYETLDASERQAIRNGGILIKRIEDVPAVPNGIIHEWSGAILIPNVKARDVVELLTDYDRHQGIYEEAIESKTLEKGANIVRGRLLLRKHKVLTVVLNTEHRAEFHQLEQNRWYMASRSTKIAEVRNFGSPEQTELPVGEDSGFLWRMNAYWGILELKDGILVECTSISLSRDIPWGLGWMIRPFVESMPREALEDTLQATRLALVTMEGGSK